ncbi:MAG: methyltransferase type 11 [uncultured bacterium]|nr:MAG: methyltransferase type 11 [uncultured bacterium]
MVGDIQNLQIGEYRVGAVISFYTFFHIPKTNQGELLKTIATFLPKGGILLVTMGDLPFEGVHTLYGAKMWVSQYGTAKNREMVESAGFGVILDEIDGSGGERHQIILAKKL